MKALSIVATIALVVSISSGYYAFKACSEVSAQRIDALVDAQLTAREMRFVETYTPKLREMFAPLRTATSEDGPAATAEDGPRDWQSYIEVLLLRAEVAMLGQRTNDASSLVATAVQCSLAADQSKLKTLRAARQVEQKEFDALCIVPLPKLREKETVKQDQEREHREDEVYNARRRAGMPVSPLEVRSGDGFGERQPKGKGAIPIVPAFDQKELLGRQMSLLEPLPTPPGFPRLARLAEFVRNSTGPELRDLALSRIRVAATYLSDVDDSEWRKTIGDACGISLSREAVIREVVLPQRDIPLFNEIRDGVKTMTPIFYVDKGGIHSFRLGGFPADFMKAIRIAIDGDEIQQRNAKDGRDYWYVVDTDSGTMTFFTSTTFVGKKLCFFYDPTDTRAPKIAIQDSNTKARGLCTKQMLIVAANHPDQVAQVVSKINPNKKMPVSSLPIPKFYTYEQLSAWVDALE